jgi:hypothetical protein
MKTKRLRRILPVPFLIIAILLSMIGSVAIVSAGTATYFVSATAEGGPGSTDLYYTNPITVNGIVSAENVSGNIDQYSVRIDWGDATYDDIPNASLNFVETSTGSGIFNGTYQSPPHSYADTGTKYIVVSLYHLQPSGNDGRFDQQCSVTISVVYSIHATAGTGGSISPEGYIQMEAGESQSFAISPDTGYEILDVLIDGASAGILTSYDFTPVSTDHTIHALFGKINLLPVADPQVVITDEDTPVTITLTGSDPDGDPLSYTIVSLPSNGVLTGTAPDITYTPDPDYYGTDNFTFKVNDGAADSLPATVSITINAVVDDALITLGNLHVTYDGNPKPVTVITDPAGLPVTVTYDGSETAPTNAGSYEVVATITDPDYTGSVTGTLVIAPAEATIDLGNLDPTYDGNPQPVTVITDPAGLPVTVTYDGSETAPTSAGSYEVVATITDPNYTGSVTDTLVIAPAEATIELGNLDPTYDGNPQPVTVITDPAGLPVIVTYDGSETAPTTPGSYEVVVTITDPNYTGSVTAILVIEPEYFTVDFQGKITSVPMGADGALLVQMNASNPEGTNWLVIPEGTIVTGPDGAIVKSVRITETAMPGLSQDKVSIGEAYNLEPSGATFSNPIIITLGYSPNALPEKITSVSLSYFVGPSDWVDVPPPTDIVSEVGQATGELQHFSIIAVTANKSPASFTVTSLEITADHQRYWGFLPFVTFTGKQVLIAVDIRNEGGLDGTFNGFVTVDGQSISVDDLTLQAGQTGKLTFSISDLGYGDHDIEVSGTTGQFETSRWINWWLIIAIVILLLTATIMTVWYLSKRRKNKAIAQAV